MTWLLSKFWPYILGALIIVAAGIWGNRYLASVEQRGYDRATAEQIAVNQKAYTKLLADRDKLAASLTAANDAALKKLGASQNENARLRNRVDSGDVGLRVAAVCPATGQPAAATGYASLDNGTGTELAPIARRAYFNLRSGIIRASAQLATCQQELTLRITAR